MSEFVSRMNLLANLESKDYIFFRNINLNWNEVISQCEDTVKRNPEYWSSLVKDEDNIEIWDEVGQNYVKSLYQNKLWGYNKHNTKVWETTAKPNKLTMPWETALLDLLPLDYAISRPTLQSPGNIMPWHQDNFHFFKRQNPKHSAFIVRFIVFMKDWDVGHIIQAGDSAITNWQAGDVILWHPTRWHLSANIGISDKWTTNVTGRLQEYVRLDKILN